MSDRSKEKDREYSRLYYLNNKERCKERFHKWFELNRGKYRRLVIEHYGGINPKCSCCGESMYEFLTIDHISGNGNQHKKAIKKTGDAFYGWLINNNYPEGYQVLCMNCNHSYGHYGYCPHNAGKTKDCNEASAT